MPVELEYWAKNLHKVYIDYLDKEDEEKQTSAKRNQQQTNSPSALDFFFIAKN